jgi:hypothetical protein
MGKKIRKLEVVKQYLKEKPVDVKPQYRSNPVLYLELLENSDKVKSELKKIPYIPKDISNVSISLNSIPIIEKDENKEIQTEEKVNIENKYKDLEDNKHKSNEKSGDKKYDDYRDSLKYDDKKNRELEFNQRKEEHKESREERRIRKDLERNNRRDRDKDRSRRKHSSRSHHSKNRDERRHSREHRRHRDRDERSRRHRSKERRKSDRRSREEKTSDELKNILRGSKNDKKEETEIRRTKDGYELPPLLTDIENGKFKKIEKELNQVESEQDRKRILLFKFEILKKSYKNEKIPDVSEYTDILYLQKVYDDTVRRLALDSTVATYKKYFTIGLMATEYVLGSWLKFDMEGFVQQQMLSMNEYEKLLVELGEKSYLSGPSTWPVEIRLIALILMNAAMFIVTKMLMKKTGSVVGNIFGNSNEPEHSIKVKKKMKGPTIDVNDLPDTKSDFIGDDKGNNLKNQ